MGESVFVYMKKRSLILFGVIVVGVFTACRDNPIPKPKAFPRIDRSNSGQKRYSGEKFSFDYSMEAFVEMMPSDDKSEIWLNISYPVYNATIHCTYAPISKERSLANLLNDSYHLAFSHSSKANSIEQEQIKCRDGKSTGTIYHIHGNVATPIQFFVTNTTNDFFRGSVYYNQSVNVDSVASVTSYLNDDILKLGQSFEWKH